MVLRNLAFLIEREAGEEIVAPAAPEEPAKVLDLMAALEASLARTGAKQSGGRAAPAKRPAKKAAAKKAPTKKPAAKRASATKKASGAAKRTRKSA